LFSRENETKSSQLRTVTTELHTVTAQLSKASSSVAQLHSENETQSSQQLHTTVTTELHTVTAQLSKASSSVAQLRSENETQSSQLQNVTAQLHDVTAQLSKASLHVARCRSDRLTGVRLQRVTAEQLDHLTVDRDAEAAGQDQLSDPVDSVVNMQTEGFQFSNCDSSGKPVRGDGETQLSFDERYNAYLGDQGPYPRTDNWDPNGMPPGGESGGGWGARAPKPAGYASGIAHLLRRASCRTVSIALGWLAPPLVATG
jgi:TolA-binding protein